MRRTCLLGLALIAAACGGSSSAPTSPGTAQNAAPDVAVAFVSTSECYPRPGQTCTVDVFAAANDVDGDALTYAWSGCATGSAARATCTVDRLGEVTAIIDVSDGRGHTVRRVIAPAGVNHPPSLSLTPIVWESDGSFELFGALSDPDEGMLCGGGLAGPCPYLVSATAAGDCRPSLTFTCGCLGGADVIASKTSPSGTCSLTIAIKDSWGLTASTTKSVTFVR